MDVGWAPWQVDDDSYGSYEVDAVVKGSAKGNGNSTSCFTCGQAGHLARDCPSRKGKGKGGKGKGFQGTRYNCGGYGHPAKDCPMASKGKGKGQSKGNSTWGLEEE